MTPRSFALPVVLLVAASALAACDGSGEPSVGEAARVIRPGDTYVALGDSYTAAPDTGPNASDTGCNNTKVNYPHLVADELELDLKDNSCDGANTTNLTDEQCVSACSAKDASFHQLRPPQLQGIDEDTDLVTIRLGANDYQLFFRIIQCATFGRNGPGSPCTDADAELGNDSIDARIADVQDNLQTGIGEIQDRAPDARIVVLGYPRVAPDEGTCDLLPLPEGDYDYARRIIEGLNDALQAVAEDADLTYIDVFAASEGHDVCSDDPWIAGLTPLSSPPVDARRLHPYPVTAEAEAELIVEALKS